MESLGILGGWRWADGVAGGGARRDRGRDRPWGDYGQADLRTASVSRTRLSKAGNPTTGGNALATSDRLRYLLPGR